MSKLKLLCLGSTFALLAFASQANAQVPYTATSTMPVMTYPGFTFSLAKLGNNNVTPMDGFASTARTGTIRLTLERCATLRRFTIHNNINATTNGVKTFELRYLGQQGTVLGSQIVNVNNGVAPQSVAVPTGGLMGFVKAIDMIITDSFDNQVEIREITLDGAPGSCCP